VAWGGGPGGGGAGCDAILGVDVEGARERGAERRRDHTPLFKAHASSVRTVDVRAGVVAATRPERAAATTTEAVGVGCRMRLPAADCGLDGWKATGVDRAGGVGGCES